MHILKILTVAFLMLEASGCGCTEVGCSDSYGVTFKKASSTWEPGSYLVSIDADGQQASCTFEMPFVKDPVCTSNLLMQLNLIPISDPSNTVKGLESVTVFGTPAHVLTTVKRDGTMLATKYFSSSYKELEPNGPTCGPTCHNDAGDLAVP